MKRFTLTVDTAGGFWTAMWSNDWNEILKESEKWLGRIMWATDDDNGLEYHFKENEWTGIGRQP